jgi:hypothetical protein
MYAAAEGESSRNMSPVLNPVMVLGAPAALPLVEAAAAATAAAATAWALIKLELTPRLVGLCVPPALEAEARPVTAGATAVALDPKCQPLTRLLSRRLGGWCWLDAGGCALPAAPPVEEYKAAAAVAATPPPPLAAPPPAVVVAVLPPGPPAALLLAGSGNKDVEVKAPLLPERAEPYWAAAAAADVAVPPPALANALA